MDIPKLRDSLLLKLYESIGEALAEDDSLPDDHKKYGVREFPDWRQTAKMFEEEMDKRKLSYAKIKW